MEQLPSLSQTLLVNVLSDLPEETKELQRSLVESATKYRTDLDKQVQSTLRLQQNVGHSHELLQKRLRRCVRSIDEANHHLKVGLADGSLANEVSELSELVMGKLMGIVSLLGARNVDGDRWPLLKSVLGQDGFEVIDEELGDMKLGNETECTRDDGHDDSNGSNGSDRETIQPLSSNTLDEHLEVSSSVSDAVGVANVMNAAGGNEDNGYEEGEGDVCVDDDGDAIDDDDADDEADDEANDEANDPDDEDEDQASMLQSIEATINKYKTKKLTPSIPLPKTTTSKGNEQLTYTVSPTSVQGLINTENGKLGDSLRKFI